MSVVLALAATPRTARRAVPFLGLLGRGTEVVSWHRTSGGPPPTAVLATSAAVLDDDLPEVPTAVWVDDLAGLHRAASHGAEVVLTSRQELVDHGAVLVPRAGADVGRWPVLPPVVRTEQRRLLDLPDQFVVAVDHREATDDIITILALASAAVVTGPLLPLALALGTPVVTGPDTARRFGLRAGVEVEVASGAAAADAAARALAAWDLGAAALSRRGRRFAETHLDLAHPAAAVRRRLGIGPLPRGGPLGRLSQRLDELATPADARIRGRAAEALAPFSDLDQGAVT